MAKRGKQRNAAPRLHPRPALATAACFALALALYWVSLRHPLLFDDRLLREDFLKLYGASWFKLDLRWLSYSTFGWTYELFGRQWPWHRLVNVVLHATTAAALFSFLARLFEAVLAAAAPGRLEPRWIAFFGALFFLLHPVAVYGVAYLAQRPIILATLLCVLCLRLFLEGLITRSRSWYYAAATAYFAAVFSKEHAVMLPAVVLALAVLIRGDPRDWARELVRPLGLFAAIALLVTLKAKGLLGTSYEPAAQALLGQLQETTPTPGESSGAWARSIINQGYLFFRYLLLWLAPYPGWMSVDLRPVFPVHVLAWPQLAGFAAWLALPVIAVRLLRQGGASGLAGFALLYPWLLALTEFAVIRVQEPFVLYRSYLWMSGLPCVLPALLRRAPFKLAFAAMAAVLVALVPLSLNRIGTFSSALALWDDAVRKNTDERASFVERAYQQRGFAHLQARQYPDALRDFEQAIVLNPRDPNAYVGRGTLRIRTGNVERALEDLDHAIELDPGYAEAWSKRCFARMLMDHPKEALADCEKAVALNPRHRDAHTNLGVVYGVLSRPADAETSYRRALSIESSNADANFNYGVLLLALNRRAEAQPPLSISCDAGIAESCKLLAALRRGR